MGSPQEHLSYTRGDAPVRLWNTELTYRSVCHWSEIVQRNIRDWHIGMCSVYSVVSDVIQRQECQLTERVEIRTRLE